MKQLVKHGLLFLIGGITYVLIELISRGRSHWSMLLLGGTCFIVLGLLNEGFRWQTPLLFQMLVGCVVITFLEYITGCIVNIYLGLNVWDYSDMWGNANGQICPLFTAIWYALSAVGIILDDYLRYYIFHEEKPRYNLL